MKVFFVILFFGNFNNFVIKFRNFAPSSLFLALLKELELLGRFWSLRLITALRPTIVSLWFWKVYSSVGKKSKKL